MSDKNNYDAVRKALNHCMKILRQIRIDELDNDFEEREEFVQLSKQGKEVCENLKNSFTEEQEELFRQFIDTKVDMYAGKGLFYYKHGFEDCKILYQLFHELSDGKISIPPLDENEIIEDWTSYGNDTETLANPQNQYKSEGIERILKISSQLDSLLIKHNEETQKSE